MRVIYGSVCSGIEAASAAWHPLGWRAAFVSEIEPFPCAVLAHHYPDVPNYGDMTKFKEWPDATLDVLVGGTPCQSFSVAGLRKGLADPRGNLMLTYLAIAAKYRPRWLVWENVPGVLSSNGGRDFASLLRGLAELGYGFAYRILDAQYFGVPQRRRRVFVVGHLGDWRRAAAVLFERHSLQGHPAPIREAGQSVAGTFKSCAGSGGWTNSADHAAAGYMQPVTAAPITASYGKQIDSSDTSKGPPNLIMEPLCMTFDRQSSGEYGTEPVASTVSARDYKSAADLVTHSLRGEGFDASEDGTGRGTPLVPIAFNWQDNHAFRASSSSSNPLRANQTEAIAIQAGACKENPDHGPDGVGVRTDGKAYTLEARSEVQAVALSLAIRGRDGTPQAELGDDKANAILTPNGGRGGVGVGAFLQSMQVRRLTPRECERLQGFPDDYTKIPLRNSKGLLNGKWAKDGPRYKALGNSMAVPCMAWISQRISQVDAIK